LSTPSPKNQPTAAAKTTVRGRQGEGETQARRNVVGVGFGRLAGRKKQKKKRPDPQRCFSKGDGLAWSRNAHRDLPSRAAFVMAQSILPSHCAKHPGAA
jgi:hypothetical protein